MKAFKQQQQQQQQQQSLIPKLNPKEEWTKLVKITNKILLVIWKFM